MFIYIRTTVPSRFRNLLQHVESCWMLEESSEVNMKGVAMSVSLNEMEFDEEDYGLRSSIIACDDLPLLCDSLLSYEPCLLQCRITLDLTVQEDHSNIAYRSLLHPFATLYALRAMVIDGVPDALAAAITAKAMRTRPEAEELLHTVKSLKDEGDRLFNSSAFALAIRTYRDALRKNLLSAHWDYKTGGHRPGEIPMYTDTGVDDALLLNLQLHSATAAAHLKHHEWTCAYFWASVAIRNVRVWNTKLGRSWRVDEESSAYFIMVYRKAFASFQLGLAASAWPEISTDLPSGTCAEPTLINDRLQNEWVVLRDYVWADSPRGDKFRDHLMDEEARAKEKEDVEAVLKAITVDVP